VKNNNFQTEPADLLKSYISHTVGKKTYFPLYKFLKFMFSSSLLLSLNSVMVVVFGSILYGFKIAPSLLLAAFLVTFGVYGLNKVTDKNEDSINRPETFTGLPYFLWLSIAASAVGLMIGLLQNTVTFIVLSTPITTGAIYSVKISKSIPRLKDILGVKSLIVALTWAITGAILPDFSLAAKANAIVIVFAYIFIRIFVGTILCDILDEKGDRAFGVKTIPLRLGRSKTKKLLLAINSFGILLLFCCIEKGILIQFMPAFLFGILYGYFAIWFFLKEDCKRLAAGLILDAEWFPAVIILSLVIK
jgi:4-hydroxybenzoate polyprenyltransferase